MVPQVLTAGSRLRVCCTVVPVLCQAVLVPVQTTNSTLLSVVSRLAVRSHRLLKRDKSSGTFITTNAHKLGGKK